MTKNWLNSAGKENGLIDYVSKKIDPNKKYENNKMFIHHLDNESMSELTCRIYNSLEIWYLFRKNVPEMLVISKQDYVNLVENTDVVDDGYIFGMKVDFFRRKVKE